MESNFKKAMFIGIEGILYIRFILIDLFGISSNQNSNYLKYSGILLCFFFVLFAVKSKGKEKDVFVLRLALGFTLVSDTFLLLTDYKEPGVASFIVVQLCYWYRLHHYQMEDLLVTFLLWAGIIGIISISSLPVDFLLAITAFYFVCLVRNVLYGLCHRQNRLFSVGLVLFLFCDLNVGLFNLAQYVSVPADVYKTLYACSSVLIWIFYLPSQVCIALSSKRDGK